MRYSNTKSINWRKQSGVSLIELLVAFVIFSFGMLGIAGLQTKTLAYGQSSLYRSQATALTDDILDRMRVDRANAINGNWNSALSTKSSDITGAAIYQTDLADWKAQVEALLPAGAAQIERDVTTGVVTITIQWDDSRAGRTSRGALDSSSEAQTFVTRTRI
jgi:type IV pilus assembly protein PilV